MPRLTSMLLGLVLLAGATACGSDSEDDAATDQGSSAPADQKSSGVELCAEMTDWILAGISLSEQITTVMESTSTPVPLDDALIAQLERRGRDADAYRTESADEELTERLGQESEFYLQAGDDKSLTSEEISESIGLLGNVNERCTVLQAESDLE